MRLASHQPDFFPYMGYFYKVFQSDVFVFSDNVQYSKSGRHNYNEILTANGPQRFTLPIHYHCVNLNEIQIAADKKTLDKMMKTLRFAYGKAKFFDCVYPILERTMGYALRNSDNLADFNYQCLRDICHLFGLYRKFYRSSDLDLKFRKDERIIEMCGLLGADTYYSGVAAKDYHIEEDYARKGIRLEYSDYVPIQYEQVGGRSEINMSVIDYLMNCGFVLPERWVKYE